MVEVLLELCGQDVAVVKNGCKIEPPTDGRSAPDTYGCPPIEEANLTAIQTFYNGQSIFVTGGTGFLGKLLIEKLLRGCPGIATIYLLIRTKKGKDVHQRIEEMFDDPLFSKLKEERPKSRHQIVPIVGDCAEPGLGISAKDRATILDEVSIVFHVAATIRFEEKIKLAVSINVRGLKDVISLCKEIPKLKSFVHVSTAYANCPHHFIEEKFYDPPMDADNLITLTECMDEKLAEEITPRLLGKWPNTYTFTKAVAESVVKREAADLPVGIFRPAIVISTYKEPLRGWVENLNGPIGVAAGAGAGLLRSVHCDGSKKADIVPGDMMVNALIACAWDASNIRKSRGAKTDDDDDGSEIPIYNYVSIDNPITYDQLKDMSAKHGLETPSTRAIWYYSFRNNKHRIVHLFCVYFLHLLPALLMDAITVCLGKRPRLLKIYKKIHKFMDVLNYFSTRDWNFSNDTFKALLAKLSAEDREKFFCDMQDVDWDFYFQTYIRGIRIYLIKDPIETLPEARVKWQRLYWIHQAVKFILAYSLARLLWAVLSSLLQLVGRA